MTTLDLQVAADADDARERSDGAGFSASSTPIRQDASTGATSRWSGGHRFTGVTIGQADNIGVAYIAVHAASSFQDSPNVDIHLNDVDDAANFTDEADVLSRARTTETTQWTASNIGLGEVNSPSIVSVVQEGVDRGLWASGNAMVALVDGRSDVSGAFQTVAHETDTTKALKLHIEFTGAGNGNGEEEAVATYLLRRRWFR